MTDFPKDLLDRYEYRSVIGSGASGVLFLAHDKRLNISVAIKMLSGKSIQDANLIRFQKEAKASGKLNHDHIVKTLDFGILSESRPYMVLDYVSGYSLKHHIESRLKFDLEQDLSLIEQVVRGMSHAHRNGIIHRDLKSNNIMIETLNESELVAKVIDFGIAHFNSLDVPEGFESTGNRLIGSPAYISPESIRVEKIDERTDIYSLGCVFFELLTGELPYNADDVVQVMEMHLNAEVPSIVPGFKFDSIEESIVNELDAIVSKCLAKQMSGRYSSMTELIEDLVIIQSRFKRSLEAESEIEKDDVASSTYGKFLDTVKPAYFSESSLQKKISILLVLLVPIAVVVVLSVGQSKPVTSTDDGTMTRIFENSMYSNIKLIDTGDNLMDGIIGAGNVTDQEIIDGTYKLAHGSSARLAGSEVTDNGVAHLNLDLVRKIDLIETRITDKSLKTISEHPGVEEVMVSFTAITDEGLGYLKKLPKLKRIYTEGTGITDNGLHIMGQIKTLEQLNIGGCSKITKQGCKSILALPQLKRLKITKTVIVPADVRGIASLRRLTYEYRPLTDDDIESIANLKNLTTLTLTYCRFPPGALKKLTRAKKLEMLNISGCTGFSEKEMSAFRRANPRCYIQTVLPYDKELPREFRERFK